LRPAYTCRLLHPQAHSLGFVSHHQSEFKTGIAAAAAAYFCWGLFPLFWKLLDGIAATELMAQRIVWCTVTVVGYLAITRNAQFWQGVERRTLFILAGSAALIATNWWVYIWAVGHGKIVESSLGYFITPLVNVLFGVVFLRERLNVAQWLAVAIAAGGVVYLTMQTGAPPWIALALALSFGSYGLIRKVAVIDAPRGLAIEGAWLLLPALLFLFVLHSKGHGNFGAVSLKITALMVCSGPLSAIPLLLFAYGARRIPLSLIGILQYIGPTLGLLSGVMLYHEPFTQVQLVGFGLTWIALAIYASDSLYRYIRQTP
jgi:chloramphenicol-sensitive protein RarD